MWDLLASFYSLLNNFFTAAVPLHNQEIQMYLTIAHLEAHLTQIAADPQAGNGYGYAYVETGRYKPYSPATVSADKRRAAWEA